MEHYKLTNIVKHPKEKLRTELTKVKPSNSASELELELKKKGRDATGNLLI